MKRTIGSFLLIALLIIGVVMTYFVSSKTEDEPEKLVAKLSFGKQGKGLGEFGSFVVPFVSPAPFSLAIKDNYLYVADIGNSRIQVLEIKY
ncbi:MAG: hypothetical protein KJ593_06580 [Candidatus Omnitrophica bacterium]|nr:hypothetical protein [Candidatus Omnitrophota bacterium]